MAQLDASLPGDGFGANARTLEERRLLTVADEHLPEIIDVRTIGIVAGIELSPRSGAPGQRAYEIFVDCFEKGLLVRVTGDIIALSPPLILEHEDIDRMMSILADAIKRTA